ncbi:pleiotropic drug resistance protein 3-like protein isoform X1 [Tanacetum coccineum]
MRIRLPLSNSVDFDTNHRTFRPRTTAPFGNKVIDYLSLISPVILGVDDPLWLHLPRYGFAVKGSKPSMEAPKNSIQSSRIAEEDEVVSFKNELWRTLTLFDSFDLLPFYLPNEVTSRCVRKPPLNDSPASVYMDGASTVANTLETKEASNGQITAAASAALGNLKSTGLSLRMQFVEEILETVELYSIKDALVGIPGVIGLSTEQHKRLTIAMEVVANPSIIFMDEPTTGSGC